LFLFPPAKATPRMMDLSMAGLAEIQRAILFRAIAMPSFDALLHGDRSCQYV